MVDLLIKLNKGKDNRYADTICAVNGREKIDYSQAEQAHTNNA